VRGHLRWFGVAVLVLAAGLAATAASGQDEHAAAQIYFYGNVSAVINSPYEKNPLVVQPASLLLFQDGSWIIDGLHWSGWGSPVAHASGVSHAKSPTAS